MAAMNLYLGAPSSTAGYYISPGFHSQKAYVDSVQFWPKLPLCTRGGGRLSTTRINSRRTYTSSLCSDFLHPPWFSRQAHCNKSSAHRQSLQMDLVIRSAANPPFPSIRIRIPAFKLSIPEVLRGQNTQDTDASSAGRLVPASGAKKNGRKHESDLSVDRALPLPMNYPDTNPLPPEAVEEMLSCDPDISDCKEVVYQWTSKCTRCMGSGFVSFRRKRSKHDTTFTCIACTGIGYVQRFTVRDDIPVMEDPDKN